MPCSPQRIIANDRNAIRTAVDLIPSSVRPIASAVLAAAIARNGTAQLRVTGNYAGEEEALIDVEILNDTVSTALPSAPVAAGAGSGVMSAVSVTGLAAQTITVELFDAGSPAAYAGIDFEGVRIRARAIGATGNGISIAIDPSSLVRTVSAYSLLEDLKAGQGDTNSGFTGVGFDWDAKVIGSEDSLIPTNAHRVSFGEDPFVYLSYKKWTGTDFTYHLVPALKRDIPAGTVVKFVTGGRGVTVTDGVTPETYPSVVTVYDLLDRLKSTSALVTVDGIVANDRTPTGQAARELNTRTDAHVDTSVGSGSEFATGFVDTFAGAGAVTELVTAKCFAVTSDDFPLAHLGGEYWTLKGSLSGDLGNIVTGVPFAGPEDRFGLTIPIKLPPGYGVAKGRFEMRSVQYVARDVADQPPICMKRLTLGPSAVDGTITLTYTQRPPEDCKCDTAPPAPPLSAFCLGILPTGDDDLSALQPDNRVRMRDLFAWKRTTVDLLTDKAEVQTAAMVNFDSGTAESLNSIVAALLGTLQTLDPLAPATVVNPSAIAVGTTTVLTVPTMTTLPLVGSSIRLENYGGADAAFVEGEDVLITAVDATHVSFASPNTTGKAITTNSGAARILFGADRVVGLEAWDETFAALKTDVASFIATQEGEYNVTAEETITQGAALVVFADGDTFRAVLHRGAATNANAFAAENIAAAAVGKVRGRGRLTGLTGLTPGLRYNASASTPGGWDTTITTGMIAGYAISATEIFVDTFTGGGGAPFGFPVDLYASKLQYVLAAAGVDPLGKSDSSILDSGDGCWKDYGGDFWTVEGPGGTYGPAFTNEPFYSVRKAAEDGKYYRTKEFGGVISIKCPEKLVYGDQITLTIGAAGWGSTYRVGDELVLPVIGARALSLVDGKAGSTLQHWYVNGSVHGGFANYDFDPASPVAYADAGLSFLLTQGGIPWQKGDRYTLAVVGGHYRTRVNGGAWSGTLTIPAGAVAVTGGGGLSIEFVPGSSPVFVAGDAFQLRALQPYAASNVQAPTVARWEWDPAAGAAPTYTVELASAQTISAAAIALHTIPEGATVTIETSADGSTWATPVALPWRPGVMFVSFAAPHTGVAFLRWSLTSAAEGGIGWLWAGAPLTTTYQSQQTLRRAYRIERGEAGLFGGGRYMASAVNGEIEWSEGSLTEADFGNLVDSLEWLKSHDDEPFIFAPQVTRPAEAFLVRVVADDVEFADVSDYGADAASDRLFSARLPLQGVWQRAAA